MITLPYAALPQRRAAPYSTIFAILAEPAGPEVLGYIAGDRRNASIVEACGRKRKTGSGGVVSCDEPSHSSPRRRSGWRLCTRREVAKIHSFAAPSHMRYVVTGGGVYFRVCNVRKGDEGS